MSHTVILDLKCQKGKGPEFLAIVLPSLADTRAYQGCQLVETYVDTDDADHIMLWEKWGERANQEAYMNWRMETGMLEGVAPFLVGPPTVTHLRNAD